MTEQGESYIALVLMRCGTTYQTLQLNSTTQVRQTIDSFR